MTPEQKLALQSFMPQGANIKTARLLMQTSRLQVMDHLLTLGSRNRCLQSTSQLSKRTVASTFHFGIRWQEPQAVNSLLDLAIVILLLAFGSLVAAGLPIVAAILVCHGSKGVLIAANFPGRCNIRTNLAQ